MPDTMEASRIFTSQAPKVETSVSGLVADSTAKVIIDLTVEDSSDDSEAPKESSGSEGPSPQAA